MAGVCGRARQALQSSSARNAVVSRLCGTKSSSFGEGASKLPGFAAFSKPKSSSPQRLFTSSRLPVELGSVQSLMPLHSVTASALLTSLLSLHAQSWGSLSEGNILSLGFALLCLLGCVYHRSNNPELKVSDVGVFLTAVASDLNSLAEISGINTSQYFWEPYWMILNYHEISLSN